MTRVICSMCIGSSVHSAYACYSNITAWVRNQQVVCTAQLKVLYLWETMVRCGMRGQREGAFECDATVIMAVVACLFLEEIK